MAAALMGMAQAAVRRRFVETDPHYASVFYIAGYESGVTDDKGRSGAVANAAAVSTSYARFGSQSLSLPADNSRVTYARTADMDIGTGNLTFDFSCRTPGSLSGAVRILFSRSALWAVAIGDLGSGFRFLWYTNGVFRVASDVIAYSTAYDVSLVRSGGIAFFYVNGARGVQDFDSESLSSATEPLLFGDTGGFNGAGGVLLDEVRLTSGVARATGATSPLRTTPFPRQGP